MRWFAHQTDAGEDPKIVKVCLKFGGDGYMLYFRTLELQGREEKPLQPDFSLAHAMFLEEKRMREIYAYFAEIGLIDAEQWKAGAVFVPKLFDRADNYTKQKMRRDLKAVPAVGDKKEADPDKRLADWCRLIETTWNATALPKIANWSDQRRRKLSERLKNNYFRIHWKKAILKMASSDFCLGKGKTGWKASVDFFLENDNNFVKALEGRYDGKGGAAGSSDPFLKKLGLTRAEIGEDE